MFNFITNTLKAFALRNKISLESKRLELMELKALENYYNILFKSSNQYYEDNEKPLTSYSLSSGSKIPIIPRQKAVEESRLICRTNAHGRNILNQIINYTVGKGFDIEFYAEYYQNKWEVLAESIHWGRFRRELIKRIARDGEAFIFRKDSKTLRFIEPDRVPGNSYSGPFKEGIVYEDYDVENVVGYIVDGEMISTDSMYHLKDPFRDMNELRGWPIMYDAQPYIRVYENWVNDRALLNRFRSSIMMIRNHKNSTTSQIEAFKDRLKSGTLRRSSTEKPIDYTFFKPGTILDKNSEIDYEFLNPNIGGQDVVDDGRAIRLLIACFFSFAEYMVTCDASNANLASTAVAEAPSVKALESWQEFYESELYYFIKWLLDFKGKRKDIVFTFPSPIVRDELKLARARTLRYQNGALSRDTWMKLDGLNAEKEMEKVNNEKLPPVVMAKINKPRGGEEDKTLPRDS